MKRYPWLNSYYYQLVQYYDTDRAHHALLLHSAPGNGPATLAYALSCWLLCQRRNGNTVCDTCHSCRLMLAGNHPDYYCLTPEKNNKHLGIEPVRHVIEKLETHAHCGGAKVIWIAHANLLSEAAVSALLKTLEEPSARTYFILVFRKPSKILATLRSRCLYWPLDNPDEEFSMQWLSCHAPGNQIEHLTALRLNNGEPITAKELLKQERWTQRGTLCSTLSDAFRKKDMLLLLPVLNLKYVEDRIHWLCTLLLDAIKYKEGAFRYIINQDQKQLIHQLISNFSSISLLSIMHRWFMCRYQLNSVVGINQELLLSEQLLNWDMKFRTTSSS